MLSDISKIILLTSGKFRKFLRKCNHLWTLFGRLRQVIEAVSVSFYMLLTVFTKFLEGARHELLAISVEFRSKKSIALQTISSSKKL